MELKITINAIMSESNTYNTGCVCLLSDTFLSVDGCRMRKHSEHHVATHGAGMINSCHSTADMHHLQRFIFHTRTYAVKNHIELFSHSFLTNQLIRNQQNYFYCFSAHISFYFIFFKCCSSLCCSLNPDCCTPRPIPPN